jgi:hypothetical protein
MVINLVHDVGVTTYLVDQMHQQVEKFLPQDALNVGGIPCMIKVNKPTGYRRISGKQLGQFVFNH